MKPQTVHSLLTARTLYDDSLRLIDTDDRHICSAGLVILQDALEIIFLALLGELGADEQRNLEKKSFDELIGELSNHGVSVPKSGTLKALNKQRIITKHYGQLAEPITVRGYAEAAETAIDSILPRVLGKRFRDVFLTELLSEGEARAFLVEAAKHIDAGHALEALIAVRKAIYVEIEVDYAIHEWHESKTGQAQTVLDWGRGGLKAPSWRRTKEWIEKNVRDPTSYVQMDHGQLRLDGIEWGVNTADLENLLRLTPQVFRAGKDKPWHTKIEIEFANSDATLPNASYCLDRAISILLRKQQHERTRRWTRGTWNFVALEQYVGKPVFSKANESSGIVDEIRADFKYAVQAEVIGFDGRTKFYAVFGYKDDGTPLADGWVSGYLVV